ALALAPAALADTAAELLVDAVGHPEMRVLRPAIVALGKAYFVLAKGFAMRGRGILLMRRAEANVAVHDDQGRTIVLGLEHRQRLLDRRPVVRIGNVKHRPAVAVESRPDVLAECERRVALDRDMIIVVDPAQVRQLEMAGDRRGLARHALHHVAVAAEDIDVVIDQRQIRPIESLREPALRHRHADAVAAALAQRPRRGLDAYG